MSSSDDTSLDDYDPFLTARTAKGSVQIKVAFPKRRKRRRPPGGVASYDRVAPPSHQLYAATKATQQPCHCKRRNCLVLFCDCFQGGVYCTTDCNCCVAATAVCKNRKGQPERSEQILQTLSRNPNAFRRRPTKRQAALLPVPAARSVPVKAATAAPQTADSELQQAWQRETLRLGQLFAAIREEEGQETSHKGATKTEVQQTGAHLLKSLKMNMEQLARVMEQAEGDHCVRPDNPTAKAAAALGDSKPAANPLRLFAPTVPGDPLAKPALPADSDGDSKPAANPLLFAAGGSTSMGTSHAGSYHAAARAGLLPAEQQGSSRAAQAAAELESKPAAQQVSEVVGTDDAELKELLGGIDKEVLGDARRQLKALAAQDVALLRELTSIIRQKTLSISKLRQVKEAS